MTPQEILADIATSDPQLPEPGMERYGTLCANVAAAPGNDPEIRALGMLLDAAFSLLSFEQREAFFEIPEVQIAEQQSARWARAAGE